ncbi:MAG: hypothetical protein DRP79_02425 [Planctomycetota bacterium]|nr:MAG: hypothetical protein DRP79_02425 [Planctomycetota bacterium]
MNTTIVAIIISLLAMLFLNALRILSRGAREGRLFGLFIKRNMFFLTLLFIFGLCRLKILADSHWGEALPFPADLLRLLPVEWAQAPDVAVYLDVIILTAAALLAIKTAMVVIFDYILKRVREVDVPGLIRTPVTWGAYLIAAAVVLQSKSKFDVTPLFTTSAVISLVLGFALQDTLSNLFTGLSIHFEKSVQIGHWIRIGEHEGRVVGVTWRAINIRTFDGDYVIIPNSTFGKMEISNYSLPTTVHAVNLFIGTSYSDPPNAVRAAILEALKRTDGVMHRPEPRIFTHSYEDFAVNYRIKFWLNDYSNHFNIESDVFTHIWYVFKRRGITIPFPTRTVQVSRAKEATKEDELKACAELLKGVDFLASLADDDFRALGEGMRLMTYAAGEEIVRQGEEGEDFFLLLDGEVEVTKTASDGRQVTVGTLKTGDFFGEMALLTGDKRTATVTSLSDTTLAVIGREYFRKLLHAKPEIAGGISEVLAERTARGLEAMERYREEVERARAAAPDEETKRIAARILKNIKKFLHL